MKRLILILVLPLFAGLQTTRAQFIVSDPANLVENATTAAQQLKQYMKMVQQLNQARKNVRHTLNQYRQQLKNLRRLPKKDWSSIDRIVRNLNEVERQADNIAYMREYVQNRYEDLYDVHERLQKLKEDPQNFRVFQDKRNEHMKNKSKKVMAASEGNLKLTEKSYRKLQKIRNQQNASQLSPQQMRQINAQVNALNSKQLIELKRIIANQASFAARKYRMSVAKKKDRRAQVQAKSKELEKQEQAFINRDHSKNDHIIPQWLR